MNCCFLIVIKGKVMRTRGCGEGVNNSINRWLSVPLQNTDTLILFCSQQLEDESRIMTFYLNIVALFICQDISGKQSAVSNK